MEKRILALPEGDYYARIAQWFHQSPRNRPISPFSHITFQTYVENRVHEDTIASLEEALRVEPNNRWALERIAELYGESSLGDPNANLFKAQLYESRALALKKSGAGEDPR